MKINKKIWTILLSLVLVFTSTGVISFAEDIEPEDAASVDEQVLLEEDVEAAEPEQVVVDEEELPEIEAAPAADEIIASEEDVQPEETVVSEPVNTVQILSDSAAGINSKVKKSLKNYRSILIAGIDNGGRADLMIVLSYNTKTKKAKVFTIGRDTYMQLNNNESYVIQGKKRDFCKCNQAADFGGIETLIKELNRHLDLNIREYIGVNWQCTADLVDILGGLPANITTNSMLNGINAELPANNKIKKIGKQTLNGWQAVHYLRVRHYYASKSDEKKKHEAGPRVREDRNRDVFVQLFNKARKMKLSEVISVYNAISDELVTNMDILDALSLIKDTAISKTPQFPYKAQNLWDPDGYLVYYVMDTNASNVKTLHQKVFGQKSYKLSSTANKLHKKTQKLAKKYLKKNQPMLNKAKVNVASTEYTGSPIIPDVSVKLGDRVLIEGSDYENSGLKAKTGIGKYSFTVKGIGIVYKGQKKSASYTIGPKGTDLLQVDAVKKGFTATWNEQSEKMPDKNITGYQIQYSLKKNFSGAKTVNVKGYTKQSATVKKLKSKKNYYVRVRTYITISKKTYYSSWSETKSVKTK